MGIFEKTTDFLPNHSKLFHVAIIPDGGRRWAKQNHIDYETSYDLMVDKFCETVDYLFQNKVDVVTGYFSSVYNFSRPSNEIISFCNAEAAFMETKVLYLVNKYNIKVKIAGSRVGIPERLNKAISFIEEKTQHFQGKQLFLCINYSSMKEIEEAVSSSDQTPFVNKLQIPIPVNFLLRSGDASVMSDFMLVQCASARLFFLKEMFNDLSMETVKTCLSSYLGYELKYGE